MREGGGHGLRRFRIAHADADLRGLELIGSLRICTNAFGARCDDFLIVECRQSDRSARWLPKYEPKWRRINARRDFDSFRIELAQVHLEVGLPGAFSVAVGRRQRHFTSQEERFRSFDVVRQFRLRSTHRV